MKYRVLLTEENKKHTNFSEEPNGFYLVDVFIDCAGRTPYLVHLLSPTTGETLATTKFRSNKKYWDQEDIDDEELGASLEHNIELLPITLLKRRPNV